MSIQASAEIPPMSIGKHYLCYGQLIVSPAVRVVQLAKFKSKMASRIELAKANIAELKAGQRPPNYLVKLAKLQTTLADFKKLKSYGIACAKATLVNPVWDLLDGDYFGTYNVKILPDNIPFGDGEMEMLNVINPATGRLVSTLVFTSGLVSSALTEQIVLPLNILKATFPVVIEINDPLAGAAQVVVTEAGAISFETILPSGLFAGERLVFEATSDGVTFTGNVFLYNSNLLAYQAEFILSEAGSK